MSVTLGLTPTPTVSLTLTPNPEQVIDVGCATGHTMLALLRRAAFKAVHGVDSAPAMVARCRANLTAAGHAAVAARCVHELDTLPPLLSLHTPLGAVLANWTLHFMSAALREAYLRSVLHALAPGGVLVLTEKTQQVMMRPSPTPNRPLAEALRRKSLLLARRRTPPRACCTTSGRRAAE